MRNLIKQFESTRKYTPEEAWFLFKIVAISEALGWTILIAGILVGHYDPQLRIYSLPIAGQIHGTIFIAYFIMLIALYPSLKWNRTTFLFSIIAGIVPYGSLVFELIVGQKKYLTTSREVSILIRQGRSIIAAQPSHGIDWQLPSISIDITKNIEEQVLVAVKNWFKIDAKIINNPDNDTYEIKLSRRIGISELVAVADRIPLVDELSLISGSDSRFLKLV